MRISAWSSDVCSSDLPGVEHVQAAEEDLVMGGDRLGSTGGIGRKGDCEGEGGAQQGRRGQGRRPAAGRQKTSELHRGSLRKSLRKVRGNCRNRSYHRLSSGRYVLFAARARRSLRRRFLDRGKRGAGCRSRTRAPLITIQVRSE